MIVLSKYTVINKYDDAYLLYNTFNNSMVAVTPLDKKNYDIIEKCISTIADDNAKKERFNYEDIDEVLSKYFFVDEDTDEFDNVVLKFMTEKYDLSKLHLIMMTNNFCNFACKYCYESHDATEISIELYDEILEAIKNYNPGKLCEISVEWFGGEPLLSLDEIIYFTIKLNQFANTNNINTYYSMTTNGYCLSLKNIERLFDVGITSFQITIDGDKFLHDSLRPLSSGGGTWDTIMNNLVGMQSLMTNFHVIIRVNYTYETLDHISGLLEYIRTNLNDNRYSIFFYDVSDWGGKSENNPLVVQADVREYILSRLLDLACDYDITPARMYSSIGRYGGICYAGLPNHFVISADGGLRKCTFTEKKNDSFNLVGSIKNGMFVINDKFSKFVIPRFDTSSECRECKYFPICMNESCPRSYVNSGASVCNKHAIAVNKLIEVKYKLFKKGKLNSVSFKGYFS